MAFALFVGTSAAAKQASFFNFLQMFEGQSSMQKSGFGWWFGNLNDLAFE